MLCYFQTLWSYYIFYGVILHIQVNNNLTIAQPRSHICIRKHSHLYIYSASVSDMHLYQWIWQFFIMSQSLYMHYIRGFVHVCVCMCIILIRLSVCKDQHFFTEGIQGLEEVVWHGSCIHMFVYVCLFLYLLVHVFAWSESNGCMLSFIRSIEKYIWY